SVLCDCGNTTRSGAPSTQAPAPTAASSSTATNAVAPRTAPGLSRYDHRPISSAIGIVHRMLNTPHALSLSEFTTTSAIAASATVITNTIAIAVAVAVNGLTWS